ncbi:MAG: c-type cytochrome [Gammaproteobacteria bacterium]|nr:c-type cytochrome [Gammaproteobacteria bacterium]
MIAMRHKLIVIITIMLLSGCGNREDRDSITQRHESADILTIAHVNGCINCHNLGASIVGPAWILVAERYRNSPDAKEYLIDKIRRGGNGNWNDITGGAQMPAHGNRVSQEHLERLVTYILSIENVGTQTRADLKE